MRKLFSFILMMGLLTFSLFVNAETSQEKGFRIAAKSDRMDNGFGTSIARLTMTLTNSAGDSTVQHL